MTLLPISSCSPTLETRGNLPNKDMLANIEVGQVNKRQVRELIGSPSTTALFEGETWYYIGNKTSTTAFFDTKVVDQQIVVIRFDKKGIVKEIKKIGLDARKKIIMVDKKTPTAGQELTILKQLFGNIGRFGGPGARMPGSVPGN